MGNGLVVVNYAQARFDFFFEQKRSLERKLHWWQNQKPYKQFSSAFIVERCSELGAMIAYYEDAIKCFAETMNKTCKPTLKEREAAEWQ